MEHLLLALERVGIQATQMLYLGSFVVSIITVANIGQRNALELFIMLMKTDK